MTCATCLNRRTVALDLFPRRRPLFVCCGICKMRRASLRHIAWRVLAFIAGATFAVLLLVELARGRR